MGDYEITRVRMSQVTDAGHEHPIAVEINGQARPADEIYTRLVSRGDDFFTRSPSTGKEASVEGFGCCGMNTLRSSMESVPDNNIDSLARF